MVELLEWKYRIETLTEDIARPVDGLLVLKLMENPTTGYRWDIENLSVEYLNILTDEFMPAVPIEIQKAHKIVGAGGCRIITLELATDLDFIRLRHGRPWSKNKPNDDAVFLTLNLV